MYIFLILKTLWTNSLMSLHKIFKKQSKIALYVLLLAFKKIWHLRHILSFT